MQGRVSYLKRLNNESLDSSPSEILIVWNDLMTNDLNRIWIGLQPPQITCRVGTRNFHGKFFTWMSLDALGTFQLHRRHCFSPKALIIRLVLSQP
jgi:hypothetical protein